MSQGYNENARRRIRTTVLRSEAQEYYSGFRPQVGVSEIVFVKLKAYSGKNHTVTGAAAYTAESLATTPLAYDGTGATAAPLVVPEYVYDLNAKIDLDEQIVMARAILLPGQVSALLCFASADQTKHFELGDRTTGGWVGYEYDIKAGALVPGGDTVTVAVHKYDTAVKGRVVHAWPVDLDVAPQLWAGLWDNVKNPPLTTTGDHQGVPAVIDDDETRTEPATPIRGHKGSGDINLETNGSPILVKVTQDGDEILHEAFAPSPEDLNYPPATNVVDCMEVDLDVVPNADKGGHDIVLRLGPDKCPVIRRNIPCCPDDKDGKDGKNGERNDDGNNDIEDEGSEKERDKESEGEGPTDGPGVTPPIIIPSLDPDNCCPEITFRQFGDGCSYSAGEVIGQFIVPADATIVSEVIGVGDATITNGVIKATGSITNGTVGACITTKSTATNCTSYAGCETCVIVTIGEECKEDSGICDLGPSENPKRGTNNSEHERGCPCEVYEFQYNYVGGSSTGDEEVKVYEPGGRNPQQWGSTNNSLTLHITINPQDGTGLIRPATVEAGAPAPHSTTTPMFDPETGCIIAGTYTLSPAISTGGGPDIESITITCGTSPGDPALNPSTEPECCFEGLDVAMVATDGYLQSTEAKKVWCIDYSYTLKRLKRQSTKRLDYITPEEREEMRNDYETITSGNYSSCVSLPTSVGSHSNSAEDQIKPDGIRAEYNMVADHATLTLRRTSTFNRKIKIAPGITETFTGDDAFVYHTGGDKYKLEVTATYTQKSVLTPNYDVAYMQVTSDCSEDNVTYAFDGSFDNAKFTINANTGVISTITGETYDSNRYVINVVATVTCEGTSPRKIRRRVVITPNGTETGEFKADAATRTAGVRARQGDVLAVIKLKGNPPAGGWDVELPENLQGLVDIRRNIDGTRSVVATSDIANGGISGEVNIVNRQGEPLDSLNLVLSFDDTKDPMRRKKVRHTDLR